MTTEEPFSAKLTGIEEKFPSQTLGNDKWYLVALSALVGVEPEHVGTLYTYLINKAEYATSESRYSLIRRIREGLVENVSIQGVAKPIEAIMSIVKVEQPEDMEFSCSRENWQLGAIYKGNLSTATDNFKANKDFDWISRNITYGLYLSDHSILGPVETELIVLTGIMIQNLKLPTAWHLRGIRRVGVSQEDVEKLQQCIELVAQFGGVSLHKVPRIADVEHEV
ncbi:hypothetical protein BJ875DRAFT_505896 [Amylocarpus encephaloides]|uniref:Carboxymuconolactone decarboxylase-like domain-containing protein n=1 Tax=Amylocarpus encephaloides TaxID=45428 RepID=A0A9P8C3Y5_9HELO|nr:hypothetical protein BJ875DRAFT_505896 [Amylocarpus encephaloides]